MSALRSQPLTSRLLVWSVAMEAKMKLTNDTYLILLSGKTWSERYYREKDLPAVPGKSLSHPTV